MQYFTTTIQHDNKSENGLLNIFEKFGKIGVYGLIYHRGCSFYATKVKNHIIAAFHKKISEKGSQTKVDWADFLEKEFKAISNIMYNAPNMRYPESEFVLPMVIW